MAATISEAQAELISSLAPDDIPIKLRCAICSKLAVNAFRLPCCEQAICENCQSNLPSSCPVCEHSPLSAADCSPNKSLRTTIRVFLRTEEKKREASKPKEPKDFTPVTPIERPDASESGTLSQTAGQDAVGANGVGSGAEVVVETEADPVKKEEVPSGQVHNAANEPNDTIEEAGGAQRETNGEEEAEPTAHNGDEQAPDENEDAGDHASEDQDNQDSYEDGDGATQGSSTGFAGSGADMNQMQMMMAMQNGMNPASFGGFPMMGMPGMAMDPMMMQNMYMNGGFQGMGMNGMGNFGGGFGQGSNDNWNGSQSWNFDQSNYNQNGPGMGSGDFGQFNPGFQAGYNNQGDYGNAFHNDYRHSNYGRGRGRGRGRGYYGGYGRGGGWYNGGSGQFHEQGQYSQYGAGNYNNQGQVEGSNAGENGAEGNADMHGDNALAQPDDAHQPGETENKANQDNEAGPEGSVPRDSLAADGSDSTALNAPVAANVPGGMQLGNAPYGNRPGPPASDAPLNAPKGPKAMRQGLPNTSLHHLRGRGFHPAHDTANSSAPSYNASAGTDSADARAAPGERYGDDDRDHDRSRDRSTERERAARSTSRDSAGRRTGYSESRRGSRSRSPRRGHESSRRRRRDRSQSKDEAYESDRSREHRSHRSRKHSRYDDAEDAAEEPRSRDEKNGGDGSRSASPDDSKRSSHRSRRDKDPERERDRDYERRRDRDKDRHRDDDRKSSHRSHRDRDHDYSQRRDRDRDDDKARQRDRDRDRDYDRDRRDRRDKKDRHRDKDRDRGRERDRGRASRHGSHSRKHSTDSRATPVDKDFKPPTGPRGFDIKGTSSRSAPQSHTSTERRDSHASNGASRGGKDPHQVEREARNRERLLKEAQRMAGMQSLAGLKRGREEGDDGGAAAAARKGRGRDGGNGRRSEAVDGNDEEERLRRMEAEREGGRWE